jgi:hypothetical protein
MSTPVEDSRRIDFERAPPRDWPDLEVVVYDVSREEMAQACARLYVALPPNQVIPGCAVLDFCERRCTIRLLPMPEERRRTILDHEQAHCLGYDHPGSTRTREAWQQHKARSCAPRKL